MYNKSGTLHLSVTVLLEQNVYNNKQNVLIKLSLPVPEPEDEEADSLLLQ